LIKITVFCYKWSRLTVGELSIVFLQVFWHNYIAHYVWSLFFLKYLMTLSYIIVGISKFVIIFKWQLWRFVWFKLVILFNFKADYSWSQTSVFGYVSQFSLPKLIKYFLYLTLLYKILVITFFLLKKTGFC